MLLILINTNTYSVNLQVMNNEVMTNPELRSMWRLGEVKGMADRIISMRSQLRNGLAANNGLRS